MLLKSQRMLKNYSINTINCITTVNISEIPTCMATDLFLYSPSHYHFQATPFMYPIFGVIIPSAKYY